MSGVGKEGRKPGRVGQPTEAAAVAFNSDMLRAARGALGLTQGAFAKKVGVQQAAVSRWEDGIRVPSDADIDRIADALKRPRDFFFLPDRLFGVDTSFMHHRKRKRVSQGTLNKLHDRINIIRLGISRLLRNFEEWPVRLEHLDADDERYSGPEQIAELTRAMLQVPRGPITNLVGLIESAGGIVIKMDFETDLIDAVQHWPWGLPPLFFLNSAAPADRARFNLAHELAHAVMHRIGTPDQETEADRFASEFLMPTREIAPDLSDLSMQQAFRLKYRWKVSAQAVIRKAKDTGAITPRKYASLFTYLSQRGYRKREPYPLEPEEPTTLKRLVRSHIDDFQYDIDSLSRLAFHIDVDEFRELFLGERPGTGPLRVFA
jgi:Zn-dependent peptidase ImmA (M78 family)/transcriptional regulator with XRE-family HTH domain